MRTILDIMVQIRQLINLQEDIHGGLTRNQINSITQIPFKKNSQKLYCGDKCVVCLTDLVEGELVKGLNCGHLFHPPCIDPWLEAKDVCPICRQKIHIQN